MKAMEQAKMNAVKKALKRYKGDRAKTCRHLGISSRTLTNYLIKWPKLRQLVKTKEETDTPMFKRYPNHNGKW